MAYAAPTLQRARADGAQVWLVSIAGTSIAAATEATITGLPQVGRIVRVVANKTAGTAATLNPQITTAAAGTGVDVVWDATAAADPVDEQPVAPVPYFSTAGTLYYQDRPNAGANNTTAVRLYIVEGWV